MAFYDNRNLRCASCHEGVKRIGREAFYRCPLLRQINLLGVKLIEAKAFYECRGLEDVEFGDVLETIGDGAFNQCIFSPCITFQSVRSIGNASFWGCTGIADVEFSENLERIGRYAFAGCSNLRRVAIPLKDVILLFPYVSSNLPKCTQFHRTKNLATVDLVGRVHNTVASLHLESWRNEMNEEIDRINRVLHTTGWYDKSYEIRQWTQSVNSRIEHYKAEHLALLKEATTLLELVLWKANLINDEDNFPDAKGKIDENIARQRQG